MLARLTFLVTSLIAVSNAYALDVQCKWKHDGREIAVVFRVEDSAGGHQMLLDRRDGRLLPMSLQSLEGMSGVIPKDSGLQSEALSQQNVQGVNGNATVLVFRDTKSKKPTASLNGRYLVSLESKDKRTHTRAQLDIMALVEAPEAFFQDTTVFTGTAMITMETEVKGANGSLDYTIGAGRRVEGFACTKLTSFNLDKLEL